MITNAINGTLNIIESHVDQVVNIPSYLGRTLSETLRTTKGVAYSVFAIFPLFGTNDRCNSLANQTAISRHIGPTLCYPIFKCINPELKHLFDLRAVDEFHKTCLDSECSQTWASPVFIQASSQGQAGATWLSRNVASRFNFAKATFISLYTRIGDLAIGVIVFPMAIVSNAARNFNLIEQKHNELITTLALTQAQAPLGFIHDLCTGVRGIINPNIEVIYSRKS